MLYPRDQNYKDCPEIRGINYTQKTFRRNGTFLKLIQWLNFTIRIGRIRRLILQHLKQKNVRAQYFHLL